MAMFTLKNGTVLSDFGKPYVVAEVNSSHNGSVALAKQMIDEIKRVGCDCVKFQSWSAESLYSKTYYSENPIAKRIVKKFSLTEESLSELAGYCRDIGLDFSSTPYSESEVDFLLDVCSAPYIKIASMDINNYPFLEYIAAKKAPIVLSTGMAEMDEVRKAVSVIENAGNTNICLLHCISIYPAEASTINLNNILGLREEFPQCTIGFSDHTYGTEIANAAVALGAALIEKHFTLDRKKMGMDNNMATEPEEMERLVNGCRNVYAALGKKERTILEAESEQRYKMRRSIVAKRNISAGHIIQKEDLTAKRPGTGITPDKLEELVGKTAVCDIAEDTLIRETDIAF